MRGFCAPPKMRNVPMVFAPLLRPLSYVIVIAAGFLLKRAGFFHARDRHLLSRIMINITLPCAVVQAFEGFSRDGSLFFIVGIGFLCALVPMLVMIPLSRGDAARLRAYRLLNVGGYNIGCFSLPLIEAFMGSASAVVACLFDTGNAVMMTGGSYAMTSTLLKTGGKRESAKDIALKFLKSAPFDTYMVMLALTALSVHLPDALFALTRPAGQANAFIAMLVIGLTFEPVRDAALLRETARELLWRYAFAAAFAAAIYFAAPLPLIARQTLVVICFSPLSTLAPIYTDRCGGDAALAGFTNSASIAVSLVVMIALSLLFVM